MDKFLKGLLCILGAVFCWSTLEVTASHIFAEGAGPITMLNLRFLIATILFGGTILYKNKKTGKNLFIVDKEDWFRVWLNGAILAFHLVVYWYAWELLDPNLPVIYAIFYMYPFIMALVAVYFYGEKFNNNRKIALGLGTLGALLAIELIPSFSTEGLNGLGIGLDVLACLSWVGYLLVGQTIMKKYDPVTMVFYDFLACFIYTSLMQWPSTTIAEVSIGYPFSLVAIIYFGVMASYVAYFLYWTSVKNIGATNTSIGELGTPLFGVTLGYFFLNWTPNVYQLIGLVLIVGGLYLIYKEKEVVYDQ
jgi:drug/metabolite transporter (DMT)-like permease